MGRDAGPEPLVPEHLLEAGPGKRNGAGILSRIESNLSRFIFHGAGAGFGTVYSGPEKRRSRPIFLVSG